MNRRESLRARLSHLCEDVRDLHARARGFETIDACMDIESVYAVESLYKAYATRVIDATNEKLCAMLASNERRAARLCEGTQTFASKARGVDRPRDVSAWNFPRRRAISYRSARDSTWFKARVLRRVETSLSLERECPSNASDKLAGSSTTKPETDNAGEETSSLSLFLYTFDQLVHPRRMMTQCLALAARAEDAREQFNKRHASAVAARAEIINHLRSIDRRVNALRRTHSETLRTEMRFDSDVLMQWWDSTRIREVVSGEEVLDENEAVDAESVVALGSDPLKYRNDALETARVRINDDDQMDASRDDEISKLREMMGRDISNDAGEIDDEACDNRQNFNASAKLQTEIVRPEFIPDDLCGGVDSNGAPFDLDNDEEWKARMGLNAEQTARLAEYGNALRLRRKAMDEQSMAIRGEIRNLVQQAKESTTAFDSKLRVLARERKEMEIDVLLYDLQRVRLAIRLHDANVAGDFATIDDDGKEDAGEAKRWTREIDQKEALKREQESRLEKASKRVNDATRAAKSATRAFRREIQDNPASRVHLEAMLKLYHHQGDILFKQPSFKSSSTSADDASSSCGVFPQGLHEQWWDRLVSARAKRSTYERDLAEARAAHERDARALRAIESELDIARQTAEECAREDAEANMKRRARRRDVDYPIRLVRGTVETSTIAAATSIQAGDLTLVSQCVVERLNAALADAVSAANRVQSQNAAARDDIDRVRWEIHALSLRCEDVTARTTEVALLRVTKRLQSFLFHVNDDGDVDDEYAADDQDEVRVARRRPSKSSAGSEVASLVVRLDRDARLHAARIARTRDGVRSLHRRAQSLRRRIAASSS